MGPTLLGFTDVSGAAAPCLRRLFGVSIYFMVGGLFSGRNVDTVLLRRYDPPQVLKDGLAHKECGMRQIIVVKLLPLLFLFFGLVLPVQAASMAYGFSSLSNKSPEYLSAQLRMAVTEVHGGALFTFGNAAGVSSSITDIYFDDAVTPLFTSISYQSASGSGVAFDSQATPANLPGGKSIGFLADYSGDANAQPLGVIDGGVNSKDEWVSFLGLWANAATFDGLLTALASDDFRVGLHIQAIGGQGVSGSYVNQLNPVPLPAAAWLFASALFGFVVVANRRKV